MFRNSKILNLQHSKILKRKRDERVTCACDWTLHSDDTELLVHEDEWYILQSDLIETHMSVHLLSELGTARLPFTDRSE